MKKILIVEDEAIIRMALRKLLERHEYTVKDAGSVDEALKFSLEEFDLIISDLRLPGAFGTDLINLAASTPVLIMTSYASLKSAVDAMRMGAVDYIAKPFDHDEMIETVNRIVTKTSPSTVFAAALDDDDTDSSKMIGSSQVMKDLYKRIKQVAPTDASVLINGETGTGKELTARAIHNQSQRSSNPLICINCAAIPDTLIESELFGHEKGAFTGAASKREGLVVAADKGTLFLDEIGELPLEAQARLLRVLQEGEVRPVGSVETQKVNIRLIAATHRDLNQLCREGLFREDLFFRLNVIQLMIPPLRDRGEDIVYIANTIIAQYCETYKKPALNLSTRAIEAIRTYYWPGNVRELENAIQRAVILCEDPKEIDADLLSLNVDLAQTESNSGTNLDSNQPANQTNQLTEELSDDTSLENYFQRFVIENQENMNETELAKSLGVSRKCLWERRQRLGIPRKKRS